MGCDALAPVWGEEGEGADVQVRFGGVCGGEDAAADAGDELALISRIDVLCVGIRRRARVVLLIVVVVVPDRDESDRSRDRVSQDLVVEFVLIRNG